MRHIVEYQPNLTQETKNYISDNINFVFSGEDTDMYSLDLVCEALREQMNQGNEKVIFDIPSKDMATLQNLVNEKVDYIEF
jgi:hypothetical protein